MTDQKSRFVTSVLNASLFAVFDRQTQFTALCESSSEADIDFVQLGQGNEELNEAQQEFDSRMPLSTWVLNVTEECNLRCRYCSRYHDDYSGTPMSDNVMLKALQVAASTAIERSQPTVVQFHGGEPLIHFERIINSIDQLSDEESAALDFRIQTNGTLLTQSIIDESRFRDIHLGISLDGPPEVNGINRRYQNGRPLGDEVVQKLGALRKQFRRHRVSCLCVMSAANIDKADLVFDYMLENQIDDLSILPLYPDYANCLTGCLEIIPRTDSMVEFSARIFDRWVNRLRQGDEICIPSFQIWIWNLLNSNVKSHLCNSCCGVGETMIFIDTNGDVYPCGPFSYSSEMRMGNILINTSRDVEASMIAERFRARMTGQIRECEDCGLQAICRGGCPANSYLNSRSLLYKDPFCEYWKGIIGHILQKVAIDPSICDLIPEYTIRL